MATTLGGYELVREIARSNDIVYEARDLAMGRRIALKELALAPNLVGEGRRERIERFYREARAAGNLSHRNIVTVYKIGEDNGRHFIAMEYLEGDSLRNILQIGGPLPLSTALDICAQICDALEYAHQHGVVHRDVKPDNIQILPDGTAKLTDFGIARLGAEPGITQAGQVFGTPSYMSPEQIVGKPVDARSDIFSMGVVLYELLTSRKPFTGDSVITITYNIMNLDPAPPAGVPPYLQAMVRRAMAKEPTQRYQSAGDMARELRQPAPPVLPFADSQPMMSLPRVTTLPTAPDPLHPPDFSSWPGQASSPYGAPYGSPQSSAYSGLPGAGHSPSNGLISALPFGTLPPSSASGPGFNGGPGAPPTANGVPGFVPPPTALPPAVTNTRAFMVKQAPFFTLLGLVLVFVLIAIGVFWALKAGYEGYQNTSESDQLFRENKQAADLLNGGNFRDAFAPLNDVVMRSRSGTPLHSSAEHNLGIYWLEAAEDARKKGDLDHARQFYQNALPLVPERQSEIQNILNILQTAPSTAQGADASTINALPAPPAPDEGLPGAPAANAAPQTSSPSADGSSSGATSTPESGLSSPSPSAGPGVTPGGEGAGVPAPANEAPGYAQALSRYQAGLHAQARGDLSTARDDYADAIQRALSLPNVPWLADAQDRFDTVAAQLSHSSLGISGL